MAIKPVCDICGTIINDHPNTILMGPQPSRVPKLHFPTPKYNFNEVCEDCYMKVYDYISELLDGNYEDATGR